MRLAIAGIVLVIIGVAIFASTLLRLINGAALDSQTKVPGAVTTVIESPGRYYVWDNHWTKFNGERVKYPADWPDTAQVMIHDSTGAELEFVPDTSKNWSIGNNEKTSVGYVDVPTATTIHIDVDQVGRDRIVTVSGRTMQQELWSRLIGFGVGIGVGIVGLPITLLGLFLRRRPSHITGDSAKLQHA